MPGPMGGRPPRGAKPTVANPGKVFKRIISFVGKNYLPHCIVVLVCIALTVFSTIQGTMFTKTLIDQYIMPLMQQDIPDYTDLLHAIIRVACFYGIGVIAAYVNTRTMVYVTQGTMRNLRNELFTHMESLPIKYFDTHAHGDIMSIYTNDVDTLRQMISQSIPQLINSSVTIVGVLASMLILNIPLTILTLVLVGLMLVVTKKATGMSGKYFVKQQKNLGEVNGFIEEMMGGQKVVKVFCHEEENMERFDKINEELCDSSYNANKFANILGPINAQIGNISYVIIAIAGGALALGGVGGFTLGGLASFLTFNKSLNMPINQVSMQFNSIIMGLAGGERIFKLLDETPEVDDGYVTLVNAVKEGDTIKESGKRTGMWAWKHYHKDTGVTDYRELKGDVVFDDVDFGYNPDKIVLHNIKMFAEPGQKIAFVGSTGAGKTTITNLINRFYDIQDGKIRYDGININKIKKDRNLSIIFITHDLGVVANMADRIAVMYAGKIVETGTCQDVFYAPAHPYTWALLSAMPDVDTNEKLEAIPGTPPNMIYPPVGDAFADRNKYALQIDFEMQPPMFKISDTHYAATWLLHPDAPKVELPKIITERIARMKSKGGAVNAE